MTAWAVASVPCWALGAFYLLGAACAIPCRRPGETSSDLTGQIISCLTFAGIVFAVAAWMST